MSTSEVRLAITGYTGSTSGGLGQGRGQPCSAPCAAVPLSRPASPSAWAAVPCENSPCARTQGIFPALLGGAPCRPPRRFSWLLGRAGLSAPVDSSPILLCAWHQSSQQDVTTDSGLFRAVVAADQHVQQVDSRRRRDSFFKCSFSGSRFCTAAVRECRLTRKAALRESFLVLFYGGEKKIVLLHEI